MIEYAWFLIADHIIPPKNYASFPYLHAQDYGSDRETNQYDPGMA